MPNLKNLTILHSNDLHGDFLSDTTDEKLVGGISMLSAYVNQTRSAVPNTLYCIAGDMLQGSIIDSEFKGMSTIEIMNLLGPDVACLGNHEIDYGIAHLLLLERCAKFPVINANMYLKNPYTRLFSPHKIIKIDGMRVMFIGIVTAAVLDAAKGDSLLSTLLDVSEAASEVGKICNAYKTTDIDLTVLLTHIGYEEDLRLASLLNPEWGVDLIIGGHTHTVLAHPTVVNDILITQAGVGTNHIGRFDLTVNTDTNRVHEYRWELIPIDDSHCPRDFAMEEIIRKYKEQTDRKYGRVLCKFPHVLTHPGRKQETELGNLFSDILKDALDLQIMLLGTGSIRKAEAGPLFTYGDLIETFPYDTKILRISPTGEQLRRMFLHMLRDEAWVDHTEFYNPSRGLKIRYNKSTHSLEEFSLNGETIQSDRLYTVGLQQFGFDNFDSFFSVPIEEVAKNAKPMVVCTSTLDVFDEYFSHMGTASMKVDGRLLLI